MRQSIFEAGVNKLLVPRAFVTVGYRRSIKIGDSSWAQPKRFVCTIMKSFFSWFARLSFFYNVKRNLFSFPEEVSELYARSLISYFIKTRSGKQFSDKTFRLMKLIYGEPWWASNYWGMKSVRIEWKRHSLLRPPTRLIFYYIKHINTSHKIRT